MIGVISYTIFFLSIVAIFAIVAIGLDLQWGYTGLFNACVVGFYAIGGYTYAILTAAPKAGLIGNLGWPWFVGFPAALLTSAIAAAIVGVATLRLRDDYLAIATFGIATSIQLVALNWEALTGGPNGLSPVTKPLVHLFPSPFAFNLAYFGLLLGIVSLVYVALARILRSPWGRVLTAIREDETAAVALGKSAVRFRLEAFVLGSALMGLAGALYVAMIGFVSPYDFLPILTFQVWAMVIVGGSGNTKGALLGALVVWAMWSLSGIAIAKLVPPQYAAQGGAIQVILIGLLLVVSLLFRPRGLIGDPVRASANRH